MGLNDMLFLCSYVISFIINAYTMVQTAVPVGKIYYPVLSCIESMTDNLLIASCLTLPVKTPTHLQSMWLFHVSVSLTKQA